MVIKPWGVDVEDVMVRRGNAIMQLWHSTAVLYRTRHWPWKVRVSQRRSSQIWSESRFPRVTICRSETQSKPVKAHKAGHGYGT